ncbi:neprilysin-1-like [Amblyomma americanum]
MVSLAGHGSKSLRDAFGYPSGNERWKECVKLLKEAMPEIVGYVYVLDKFSAKAKKEVEGLAERIKQAYKDQLQRSDWMDNKTKQAAQEKLSKMAAKVGYPEWQLNTTYLEELYQHVPHLPLNSSFLKYWHEITQNNWIRHLRKLRESPVNTSDWIIGPAEVNAFYSPNSNELVYPSAILQSLFYEPGLPWSLNMGSLGAVMAHEMTHGFDLNGGQFDAHGKFTDWWSNGTRSSFHKKADCFRKQYENITDPDANMTLNSEQTLNEDIADNGGLRIALTTWCGITEEQRLKGDIHYSKYSPNKYRLLFPSNLSRPVINS